MATSSSHIHGFNAELSLDDNAHHRSGAAGFLLPLSGGADSSAVAAIVGVMCNLVMEAIEEGNSRVLQDARRVLGKGDDPTYR